MSNFTDEPLPEWLKIAVGYKENDTPSEGITIAEKAHLLANMIGNGLVQGDGLTFEKKDAVRLKIDPYARQFTAEVYRDLAPEKDSGFDGWEISREDENYTDISDLLFKLYIDGLINKIYEQEEE